MNKSLALLLPAILFACADNKTPYYDSESSVSVSEIDVKQEMGNMGRNRGNVRVKGLGLGD